MNKKKITSKHINLLNILSVFPIAMVILDPYALTSGGIAICDILVILMASYVILSNKMVIYIPFFLLISIDVFLSLISFAFTSNSNTDFFLSMKISIVFSLYLLVYSSIWMQLDCCCGKKFYNLVEIGGLFCAILAISQFIFSSIGINFYDGKLPLPLVENSYFGGLFDSNTGDLRVHSLFEEPSYMALFEIPVTVHLIQEKKYIKSIICGTTCIISGSLIGILGLLIALISMLFFDDDIKIKTKLNFVFVGLIIIGLIFITYSINGSIKDLFDYYIRRFVTMENSSKRNDSSFSQRIIGNISLFENYNYFNKFVGVGFNQYPLFFGLEFDYSNDIVSNLLNFGYIGFFSLLSVLISIAKNLTGQGKVFFLIFCMLLSVDHSWFGPMFFYILTWVITKSNQKQSSLLVSVKI